MKKIFNSFALILITILSVQTLKAENIDGKVLYQGDESRPITNVIVVLENVDNNTIETYTTGGDGFFEFTNVSEGNYTLTGSTTINAGGVTFYDPTMVFLHLIGFYEMTPMQEMASDVDGSGNVSWTDYNMIINFILNGVPFPIGPWTFESQSFSVSDLKDGVPHGLGGTCSGDVGGTFIPQVNNAPALPLTQEGFINVSTGEPFTTRILTHNEISITGAGIIINYPSELLQVNSVEFKGGDFDYTINNGQIRLVWGNPNTSPVNFNEGETFITIHGVSTSAFTQGMTANISLDGNTSLMNSSNQEVSKLNFASPVIKYGNPSLKLSNYPNPFATSTKLSIYTPEEGNTTIEVYNTNGQMVKNILVGMMNAGYNEVTLDASQMAKGYYVCKIRVQSESSELTSSIRILKAK